MIREGPEAKYGPRRGMSVLGSGAISRFAASWRRKMRKRGGARRPDLPLPSQPTLATNRGTGHKIKPDDDRKRNQASPEG